ncbi:MAG: HAMP domain-containing protein, partial [Acidobacteria bacterium]|nr:HAMP domain-containing protein [Acidobacteriota bacterium]
MSLAFSPKLRLAPLWPATAALLVVATLLLFQLPGILAESAARDLQDTAQLAARGLTLPTALPDRLPDPALQERVRAWVRGTSLRLTVIAGDGRVFSDSARTEAEVAAMENHGKRPEVFAALARGAGHSTRTSATTGIETAYAACLVPAEGGPTWVVRVALPIASAAEVRRHLTRALLLSALVAALVVAALSAWLRHRLFRPLDQLIAAADALGRGDYDQVVPIPDPPELATLGRALERISTEARSQIAAVAAERNHLRSTVTGMSEGVLVADREGRTTLLNPAFRDLFGIASDAPSEEVLALAREPRLGDLIERALVDKTAETVQIELPEPRRRIVALVAGPLLGDQGVVVVARDVTQSERLHQMRRDFVANVSHELRTPLSAIRGYAETLVDGAAGDAETSLRFSRRILEQCRRLTELLDDLLTLSRLEGAEPLRGLEEVDLRETAAEAIEMLVTQAAAKQIRVELEPGPTAEVRGDADGLLRLVANLLDNAIKYNRDGGEVRLRLATGEGEAQLEVSDSGIGIPAASLPRIFERFYRVDKGRAREEGGTGLGLAIVKH